MTRSAPPMLLPVTAERFRVRLYMATLPTFRTPQAALLVTLLLTFVRRVTPVRPVVLRRPPILTNIAPIEPVAVRQRPTHLQPAPNVPGIRVAAFGAALNARLEPLPKTAPKPIFLRVVFSKLNGPTAEFGLNAVRAVPPSRPARQLPFVHTVPMELAPRLIVTLFIRTSLGTFLGWALLIRRTLLRTLPLSAAMTPQLLALRLLVANVPEPISLPPIAASRHLPVLVTRPSRRTLVMVGNRVLPPLRVATQLLLPTTSSMWLHCPLVRLRPMVGLYESGVGTTLVNTVVLDKARLSVPPPKHVPVVVRTLHVL